MKERFVYKTIENFDYEGWGISIQKVISLDNPLQQHKYSYSFQSPQYRNTNGWLSNGRSYESFEDAVLAGIAEIDKKIS